MWPEYPRAKSERSSVAVHGKVIFYSQTFAWKRIGNFCRNGREPDFLNGAKAYVSKSFIRRVFGEPEILYLTIPVNGKCDRGGPNTYEPALLIRGHVIIPSRSDCVVKSFLIETERRADGVDRRWSAICNVSGDASLLFLRLKIRRGIFRPGPRHNRRG